MGTTPWGSLGHRQLYGLVALAHWYRRTGLPATLRQVQQELAQCCVGAEQHSPTRNSLMGLRGRGLLTHRVGRHGSLRPTTQGMRMAALLIVEGTVEVSDGVATILTEDIPPPDLERMELLEERIETLERSLAGLRRQAGLL